MTEENKEQIVIPEDFKETRNMAPEELEKAMVEKAQQKESDPTEVAAMAHQLYLPQFYNGIATLSVRGLRRVVKHMVEYPLNIKELRLSQKEKDLVAIADMLLQAKAMLMLYAQHEAIEAFQKQDLTFGEQTDTVIETQTVETIKE